jgi:hypothetical protein
MWSGRYICPILTKIWIYATDFHEVLKSSFTKVLPVRIAMMYADRWTGGRTDRTKPTGALRYLCEHAWKVEFCASVRKMKYHVMLYREIVISILKSYGTHKYTVWAKCRIFSVPGCTGRPRPWLWFTVKIMCIRWNAHWYRKSKCFIICFFSKRCRMTSLTSQTDIHYVHKVLVKI